MIFRMQKAEVNELRELQRASDADKEQARRGLERSLTELKACLSYNMLLESHAEKTA